MIDLYYAPTPNGWKVSIILEELGLSYRLIPVDIRAGEQFKPEFLEISPNNRIPAIIDYEPAGGGEPFSVFESGAILTYLADKTGCFLPSDLRGRSKAIQWVMWQVSGLGPMLGQHGHFAL
jgi:GST-like protein